MDLEYAASSDIGDRELNEDAYQHLITKDFAMFVIADGLGGREASELASYYFTDSLIKLAKNEFSDSLIDPKLKLEKIIIAAMHEMSSRLIASNHKEAGTVFAVVWLNNSKLITIHVGDCRIYLLRKEQICWRTKDHSLIEELFANNRITEMEMLNHPQQNVLLRSLSVGNFPELEVHVHNPLRPDDLLLLCTDGFWRYLMPGEIIQLSQSQQLESDLKLLVKEAVSRGNPSADNTTAQAIRLSRTK